MMTMMMCVPPKIPEDPDVDRTPCPPSLQFSRMSSICVLFGGADTNLKDEMNPKRV